jgi:enoyl-CoA hydratase
MPAEQGIAMTDLLLVERRDGYAILTLNRPEALNAMSAGLLQALIETCEDMEVDPSVRGLIVTGAGRAFCAGMDLKELQDPNGPLSQAGGIWSDGTPNAVARLAHFSKPTIAAVNGAAVTGGFELALVCDVIVASTMARFGDTHARVGIISGGGASQLLSRLIGIHRAKELSLTGKLISAEQAEHWGLVNRVVEADALLPTAEEIMCDMLQVDDDMLVTYKKLINDGFALPYGEGLRLEEQTARAHANRNSTEEIRKRTQMLLERERSR